MNDMFGINPERTVYISEAVKPLAHENMINAICGHNYIALSGLWFSWRCPSEGRCPSLAYQTLSGLISVKRPTRPEGALYT